MATSPRFVLHSRTLFYLTSARPHHGQKQLSLAIARLRSPLQFSRTNHTDTATWDWPIFHADKPPQTKQQKFTYDAAAAFSAKHKKFDPRRHVFHFNRYNRIQTEKKGHKSSRPASGQDAFFISRVGNTDGIALGVADGVGGWEESGVDPADFAHSFCDYMAFAAHDHRPDDGWTPLAPRALMQRGYDDVVKDRSIHAGGSTATVAVADEDGKLEVANLGDSGFVHLRLNAIHAFSTPQTHAFNTPYQLSIIPTSMLARAATFGGAQLCDYPKDADVTQLDLKHGDILVFASDGVWDNVFNQDILGIVSRTMMDIGAWRKSEDGLQVADSLRRFTSGHKSNGRPVTLQSALAVEIAALAKTASTNQRVDGPFAKEVQKYYPAENWHGGKVDDICVIVLVVTDNRLAPKMESYF
ncbi:phosphatase 2C-like domain-containing protein [Xylaria sp. FL0043]|nr:phosphatase 2C-like domain-containing protein [Xylaria sp. FL0043]